MDPPSEMARPSNVITPAIKNNRRQRAGRGSKESRLSYANSVHNMVLYNIKMGKTSLYFVRIRIFGHPSSHDFCPSGLDGPIFLDDFCVVPS